MWWRLKFAAPTPIGGVGSDRLIETVHGTGYRFNAINGAK